MVYSFDIFDTLITRLTLTPYGVFLILQKKILLYDDFDCIDSNFRNHFSEIRICGEKECRRLTSKEEINISDIYDYIQLKYNIPKSIISKIIGLELELEFELSLPIQKNIELLKKYYQTDKVYLISDMYLSENQIRKLLVKHDDIFSEIPIFVSSDLNKSKASGSLYEYFINKTGVSTDEWIHYGDNPVSDKKSELYGATFCLIKNDNVSSLENYKRKTFCDDLQQELSLGLIKNTISDLSNNNVYYNFGLEVAAPVLFSYIKWVIKDALKNNTDTLYFITRDGVVLKSIADTIIVQENLKIKTKLIYGSRKSIRQPLILSNQTCIEKVLKQQRYRNLRELSELIDFDVKNMNFDSYLLCCHSLSFMDKQFIIKQILSNKKNLERIVTKSKDKIIAATGYLLQEIDLTENFSFVELQGTGKTQQCICSILSNAKKIKPTNYYFWLYDIDYESNCSFKTFSYEDSGSIIELFCRAPFRQVKSYLYRNNKYEPVFDDSIKDDFPESNFESYIDGIKDYVSAAEKYNIYSYSDFYDYSINLIKNLLNCTESTVKDFICKIPFGDPLCDTRVINYAPVLTQSFINELYSMKYKNEWLYCYKGFSFDYSLKCSDESIQKQYEKFLVYNDSLPENNIQIPYLKGKIVIYGAGKVGKKLYESLKNNLNVEIVLWCDKNYKEKSEIISDPQLIYTANFDYLLIAIKNELINQDVKSEFVLNGIKTEKII